MSNPNCSQVDNRPSPVPDGTVGLFEGAHYYHCGAFRPEYNCKMRALDVPFCRICRQVIWNRISPLATLPARDRTPISVVARFPAHLDVFAVASDGRTMSNWWDKRAGDGLVSCPRRHRFAGRRGRTRDCGRSLRRPPRPVHGWHGQPRLQLLVGRRQRMAWVVSDRQLAVPPRLYRQRCLPLQRPYRPIHHCVGWPDHVHLVEYYTGWADWFHVQGGVAAAGAKVTAVARYPFHLDLFMVGTDNRVYSCWWDERSGWHNWFRGGQFICRPDSTVTVVSRFPDQLDLFTTASDGKIMSIGGTQGPAGETGFRLPAGSLHPARP